MRGEAAVNIIAWHFLVRTNCSLATSADIAVAARNNRRNNNCPVGVVEGVGTSIDDTTANLVPKRQRQLMFGANAIVIIAEIGVTHPTASNFNQNFVGLQGTN